MDILELKNTISEIKVQYMDLTVILTMTEERVGKLEHRSV